MKRNYRVMYCHSKKHIKYLIFEERNSGTISHDFPIPKACEATLWLQLKEKSNTIFRIRLTSNVGTFLGFLFLLSFTAFSTFFYVVVLPLSVLSVGSIRWYCPMSICYGENNFASLSLFYFLCTHV